MPKRKSNMLLVFQADCLLRVQVVCMVVIMAEVICINQATIITHTVYPFKVFFFYTAWKMKGCSLMYGPWLTLISVETTSNPPITNSRGAITMRGRREYPMTPRTWPKETCSKEQQDSIRKCFFCFTKTIWAMSDWILTGCRRWRGVSCTYLTTENTSQQEDC